MSAEDDKKARLASALRANLARRKAQGRARAAPADEPASGPAEPNADEAGPGAGETEASRGLGKGRIVPPGGAR